MSDLKGKPLWKSAGPGTSRGACKVQIGSKAKAKESLSEEDEVPLQRVKSEELIVRYDIKKLAAWFQTWETWQQRLLVCTVMNGSTKQQLMMLATSLEPVLHLDFCSILVPPLRSLHQEGVALFQNRRAITHRYVLPEIIPRIDSKSSLPSTLLSEKTTMLSTLPIENISTSSLGKTISQIQSPQSPIKTSTPTMTRSSNYLLALKRPLKGNLAVPTKTAAKAERAIKLKKKEAILPALPLTHPDHLPSPDACCFDQMLDLKRQRFSSVPEFRSTMELMKKSGRSWGSRKKGDVQLRRKTVNTYYAPMQSLQQKTEHFKEQLAQVTSVSAASE
jgi:hypothetical protein